MIAKDGDVAYGPVTELNDRWSRLEPRTFYLTTGWLAASGSTVSSSPRVLMTADAGTSVSILGPGSYRLYDPLRVLAAAVQNGEDHLSPLSAAWYPVAVAVAPGFVTGVAFRPGLAEADRVAAARSLVEQVDAVAEREGASATAFLYLPVSREPELTEALDNAGYSRGVVGAECYLPLSWRSLEEYVAAGSKSRQEMIRREMRRFRDAGLRITVAGAEVLDEEVARLHAAWRARYGSHLAVADLLQQYDLLRAHVARELRVLRVWRADRLVGFATFYVHDGVWYARAVGFDYDHLERGDFCYFNVVFYEPVRLALDEGATRIEYSMESYDAKIRRGCLLRPLSLALRVPERNSDDVGKLLALAEQRTAHRFNALT